MRFFLDHCVSNSVANSLQSGGHEVFRLKDHLPVESSDPVVIQKAQELSCILVTLNGDFVQIIDYPPANYLGIVALQIKNRPEAVEPAMGQLHSYIADHNNAAEFRGKLLLVEPHRIRIRQ